MKSFKLALISVTLAVLLWPSGGSAAASDFDVAVNPGNSYPGVKIKIFGFAEPTSSTAPKILFELTKPLSGDIVTETVMARSNGLYELVFDDTDELGVWKVKATHQGKHKTLTTSFEVSTGALFSPLIGEMRRVKVALTTATEEFKPALDTIPDFPGEEALKEKADRALEKLEELNQTVQQLDALAQQLQADLESKADEVPAEVKEEISEAAGHTAEARQAVQLGADEIERLIEETRRATDWCFMFQSYEMIFSRASVMLETVDDKLTGAMTNYARAKVKQQCPFWLVTYLNAVQELWGTRTWSPGQPPVTMLGLVQYLGGVFLGLGEQVAKQVIAHYCQEFKGKVKGDYYAELLHQEIPFLTMSYLHEGELRLVFQKRDPGQPVVKLKGRLIGSITHPKCEMTMMPFDLADTFAPSWCRSAVPEIGSRSFLLYLTGRAFEDRMEIDFDRTGYDFDLKTWGYFVKLSTHTPVPIPGSVVFPLMDAEWFFTRITHLSNPNSDFIKLPIEVTDKGSEAKEKYNRVMNFDETPHRKGVHIEMNMEIELCSGCP